jgi:O-antigen ligase
MSNEVFLTVGIVGLFCLLLPMDMVVVASILATYMADTRLIPGDIIYWVRFVPGAVLAFRILAILLRWRLPVKSSMIRAWFLFAVMALGSTIYSAEPAVTFQRAVSFILILTGFGLGIPICFGDKRKMNRLLWMTGVLMGGLVVYSFISSRGVNFRASDVEFERLHGIFRNPNTLGLVAMESFFMVNYLWRRERDLILRSVFLSANVIVGVMILLSGSRAASLSCFAGILAMLWLDRRVLGKRISRRISIGVFVGVIAFGAVYLSPKLTSVLFREGSGWRDLLLRQDWELAQNALWMGVGFGGSDRIYHEKMIEMQMRLGYSMGSHHSFLKLLVEMGLVGLALGLWALVRMMTRIYRMLPHFEDRQLGVALFPALLACLVNAQMESWLFSFGSSATLPFWFFLALLSYQADKAEWLMAKARAARGPR